MSYTITTEHAAVFRVGRRRFLTERAAIAHLARMRVAEMRACECEPAEFDGYSVVTWPGFTCARHREEVVSRYARLLRRAWRPRPVSASRTRSISVKTRRTRPTSGSEWSKPEVQP